MPVDNSSYRTCFVSAPSGLKLTSLSDSLLARGIQPLIPQQLAVGTDWASEIQHELSRADFVIGVLAAGRRSSWVLFELGQAWALGKQILLIVSPKSEPIPFALQRFLVLRIDLKNREAIDFALDQLLSAKSALSPETSRVPFVSSGLGPRADDLLRRLDDPSKANYERELEDIVRTAVQDAGAELVVEPPKHHRGADLAVWSDVLEPFVGNPLLIEIKRKIDDSVTAEHAFQQLKQYIGAAGTRWGLLIYAEGPPPEHRIWKRCPSNILFVSIRSLVESLRNQAFPEVIRDLRNRRVHSVRP
jgi:hypothetical protein